LRFHSIDNPQMLAYTKSSEDGETTILVVVNLDPHHTQRGWIKLETDFAKGSARPSFQAHDLLTNDRYLWQPGSNYVELNPQFVPAHVLRLRRFVRTEHNFDYFL
jgi:starch synthase (maltosyl-transferring)